MICGDSSLQLNEFMSFLATSEKYTFTLESIRRVHLHWKMWRYVQHVRKSEKEKRLKVTNCTSLLLLARPQDSTESRDKIFAFQGLLTLLGVQAPAPDNSKSVAEVYREAAALAIRHDNSLSILSSVTGTTGVSQLPSWVPDWSDTRPISHVAPWKKTLGRGYNQMFYYISADSTLLTLRGGISNIIQETSPSFPNYHSLQEPGAQKSELDTLQEWIIIFGEAPETNCSSIGIKKSCFLLPWACCHVGLYGYYSVHRGGCPKVDERNSKLEERHGDCRSSSSPRTYSYSRFEI